MAQNNHPELAETPTANVDALDNMCIITVEFAETTFENLQEKIRISAWVLKSMKENFKARNDELQGNLSEYDTSFQNASDHDLPDSEDSATLSEGDHEESKRPVNDTSNGGQVIEDDVSEDDHGEHSVSSMNASVSNSITLLSESKDNSEAEQYNPASYEENASIDDEDETMEDDAFADEQEISDDAEEDTSDDGAAENDYEDFSNEDIPETSKADNAKNLREFMNEHNQNKIIAQQQAKIVELKLANLNFVSETNEAESLEHLSNTIAADEASLKNQKQCRDELDTMIKQIIARTGVLRAHISKKRPDPLPEEDAGHIRDFCEECEQDIEVLLASYRFVLEHLSAKGDDEDEEGDDEGEAEEEYDGEHEGEDQGEDEANLQGEATLAPVQSGPLTFTLPFVGGKRGREVAADDEEPAAKRGRFIEEEL